MQIKADMPREKLSKKGAQALTDNELLQALIGSGGKGNDYKQIAKTSTIPLKKSALIGCR